MAKQLFETVSNTELELRIRQELRYVQIVGIEYDSRSHNTEYSRIFFNYRGLSIDEPFIEIVDDNEFSLDDECALGFEFIGNKDDAGFVLFTAVVLRAQNLIDRRGLIVNGSLTNQYVSAKCDDMNYILDKTTSREPWDLYTKQGVLLDSYPSLAAVDTRLELEKIGVSDSEKEEEEEYEEKEEDDC